MKWVMPRDAGYEHDRQIANARFDYFPSAICYCTNAADVKEALAVARDGEGKVGIRVRSGGHQHEGMCSGDEILMIDVSQLNQITFTSDTTARIGVGAKLGDIYETLLRENRILPGGGCGDVHIGGLAQGGGWGLYARAMGLTCDNILGFGIVLADGTLVDAPGLNPAGDDLPWAIRGGGGGNFGVVTEYDVQLTEVEWIWQFTLTWTAAAMRELVMEEWRENFPHDSDHRLTSFCRVSSEAGRQDPPIICAGNFLGDAESLVKLLTRLLPGTFAHCTSDFSPVHWPDGRWTNRVFHHPQYQPGPPQPATVPAIAALEQPPSSTCDGGSYPNKVSSCYPRPTYSLEASRTITRFLDDHQEADLNARRYVSLHCLGGAVENPPLGLPSCFAFRDKPFMLQYQAWWGDAQDKLLEDRCLRWIQDFRLTMEQFTEGAFINFPDDTIPIEQYYGDNFWRLTTVKEKVDRNNLFSFPMGIPSVAV